MRLETSEPSFGVALGLLGGLQSNDAELTVAALLWML
jgi:hypothetical protein